MLEQGINVGLGTDGAASNNRLDMFEEMRLAALLAKGTSGKADRPAGIEALQWRHSTAHGAGPGQTDWARCCRGKAADIAAVNSRPGNQPCYDAISHLVYAAGREHVSHVWVNGKPVVENGSLLTLDAETAFSSSRSVARTHR